MMEELLRANEMTNIVHSMSFTTMKKLLNANAALKKMQE